MGRVRGFSRPDRPESGRVTHRRRWTATTTALLAVILGLAGAAAASTSIDRQANNPQVAGDPTSNSKAVFPTNKQNEPTIAVNPIFPDRLIAGANDEQRQPPCGPGPVRGVVPASDCSFFLDVGTSGVYTSNDGGMTWLNRGLLDDQASWVAADLVSDGDPVIVYGPKPTGIGGFSYANGARAYYATLASYKSGRSPYPPNKAPELLAVSFSDDDGITWSAPVIATVKRNPNDFNDKEAIWVDDLPTSPYFGRVYLTWTEFRSMICCPAEPVMVSVSTDAGATFSAPKGLSPAGNNRTGNGRQGAAVRTGPDGTVYVAWEQGSDQVVSVSSDGGNRWTRPSVIGPVADILDPIPGANFRTDSFLSLAVDPESGAAYAAWVNHTADGGRVVVTKSTDRGATWSTPTVVSTAGEGYAFFQGIDVAPNGRVDVGYQAMTTVNPATFGTGNAQINSWYVSNAGAGWSTPMKVSTAGSDPAATAQNNLARQFFGDYNTLVSTNTFAWFIYTDTRNGVGCADVDQYQRIIAGTGTVRGDMGDRIATRLGQNPYSHDPGFKPAPPEHCSTAFGNSDAYVSRISLP
jgi:hypothetical protein